MQAPERAARGRSLVRRAASWTRGRIRYSAEARAKRAAATRSVYAFEAEGARPRGAGPHPVPLLLAFYLPQFHPIPENDAWWGPGFTEWTNVASAKPHFRGHRQPSLPRDLGFYDLRLAETREAQARLAREYGVAGFCYWHYWFDGRRLLHRPLDEVLESGRPDLPFCLSWANESWTRTWLNSGEVLLEQTYSDDDDASHAEWLARVFQDSRYIRINSRPVFLVYNPAAHPNLRGFTEQLRRAASRQGDEAPLILGMNGWSPKTDWRAGGLDGTVDFQPQFGDLPGIRHRGWSASRVLRNLRRGRLDGALSLWDYREAHRLMLKRRLNLGFPTVPTILVGWDNAPRRGRKAIVLTDNDPAYFTAALTRELVTVATDPDVTPLVFVNAWNEWAEGNHLEPGLRLGRAHLEAVRSAVAKANEVLGGSSAPERGGHA